jgi:hypothetical protein
MPSGPEWRKPSSSTQSIRTDCTTPPSNVMQARLPTFSLRASRISLGVMVVVGGLQVEPEPPTSRRNGNGSVAGAILDNRSVNRHSIHAQYENTNTACQVTGRLSLFYLPKLSSIRTYAQRKSGPDGIRTRICHLDRVPCYRYTTGPRKLSVRAGANARSSVTV